MSEKEPRAPRELARNRRARHEYEILDVLEAGIVLTGSEVKSARAGGVSLEEACVRLRADGAVLEKAHFAEWAQAAVGGHDPLRLRPLLLHKGEIRKLRAQVREKGLTVVPLRLLASGRWIKLEIGLARGRQLHDTRERIRSRDVERELRRAVRRGP